MVCKGKDDVNRREWYCKGKDDVNRRDWYCKGNDDVNRRGGFVRESIQKSGMLAHTTFIVFDSFLPLLWG